MEISIDDFSSSRSSTKTLLKSTPKAPLFFLVMLILLKISKKFYPSFVSRILTKFKKLINPSKNPPNIAVIAPELIKKKEEFEKIIIKIQNKKNVIFNESLRRINNLFEEEIFLMNETFVQQIQNNISAINITKKLKLYIFCVFGIKLMEVLEKLRMVLKEKYLEKFSKKYSDIILDAPQILDFVTNEFFETLFQQGLNGVIGYMDKIFDSHKFELNEKLSLQKIFIFLEKIQTDLIASQSEFNANIKNANFHFITSLCFYYFRFLKFVFL